MEYQHEIERARTKDFFFLSMERTKSAKRNISLSRQQTWGTLSLANIYIPTKQPPRRMSLTLCSLSLIETLPFFFPPMMRMYWMSGHVSTVWENYISTIKLNFFFFLFAEINICWVSLRVFVFGKQQFSHTLVHLQPTMMMMTTTIRFFFGSYKIATRKIAKLF